MEKLREATRNRDWRASNAPGHGETFTTQSNQPPQTGYGPRGPRNSQTYGAGGQVAPYQYGAGYGRAGTAGSQELSGSYDVVLQGLIRALYPEEPGNLQSQVSTVGQLGRMYYLEPTQALEMAQGELEPFRKERPS